MSRKRLFPEIFFFSKKSDVSGIPNKHPKSFGIISKQVEKGSISVFRRISLAADILRLGTLIRTKNKNDVKDVVENFDITKTETYFEIEGMHFAEVVFRKA